MSQTKQKTPKPITAQRLMNAATHYLGRFEATQARLRRVLEQKVKRWSLCQDISEYTALIEETVAKCVRLDLVDDARYGVMRKTQLLRKGKAARLIAQDLRHKGLKEPVAASIAGSVQAHEERQAAITLAKRRRLGPFRGERECAAFDLDPQKQQRKEIAVFARAGHGFQTAQALLACANEAEAEQWLEQSE